MSLTHLLLFIFLWGVTRIANLDICPIKQLGTVANAGRLLPPRHREVSVCCSEGTGTCHPVSRFAQHVCSGAQMPLTRQTEAQVSLSYQWKSVLCVPVQYASLQKVDNKDILHVKKNPTPTRNWHYHFTVCSSNLFNINIIGIFGGEKKLNRTHMCLFFWPWSHIINAITFKMYML